MQEITAGGGVGGEGQGQPTMSHVLCLFFFLGQLAKRVCRLPQVSLITITNGDLSGSRGRHELMEVGSAFLTLLALLEKPCSGNLWALFNKCFFDPRLPWTRCENTQLAKWGGYLSDEAM